MANNYTTVSKKGIEYLCSLINQLANVSEGIDDLNLRTDGTFSSVKIDTLLNTLKTDCNEYTDRLVANLSRLELKIATSESEITQPNTMYLYKPSGSTSYEQYVVIEGTKVLLGTTDINMGDYYTITQADGKFVLKTDFDSLKTTVDKKVDKTDIVDNLTSTDTDKPLSANQGKVLKDEVDLKANDNDVVKKTDIVTTIDSRSTDGKIPTSLAVRNAILGMSVSNNATYGGDVLYFPCGIYKIANNTVAESLTNLPIAAAGILQILSISSHNNDLSTYTYVYRTYIFIPIGKRDIYIRNISTGSIANVFTVDTGWKKVCTTSVADVGRTFVPFTSPNNMTVYKNTERPELFGLYYIVKNGVCYVDVTMSIVTVGELNGFVSICKGLPKPAISYVRNEVNSWNDKTAPTLGLAINGDSNELLLSAYNMSSPTLTASNPQSYFGYFKSFSYPVIES